MSPTERRESRVGHQGEPVSACRGPACMQPGDRGHMAEGRSRFPPVRFPWGVGGPLLTASSSGLHLKCSLSLSLLLPFASLLAAPPVKGKRKQSEEGDPLDPSVSPQPDGEQSRSQSPVHPEVSLATPGESLPCPPPSPVHSLPGEPGDSPSSQEGVFPILQPHSLGPASGGVGAGSQGGRTHPSPEAGVPDLVFLAEPF